MKVTVGDQLVVPNCGVGRVAGLEHMEVGTESVDLVRIQLYKDDSLIWVPLDKLQEQGVRPVMPQEWVEEAWKLIESQEAPAKREHWNRRQRRYNEEIMSNRPTSLARVLGELRAKREASKLTFTEKRIFRKVQELLVSEFAAAMGTAREAVESRMESTLQVA